MTYMHSCGARWASSTACHCAHCHATFATLALFDAHASGHGADAVHLSPEAMGLVWDGGRGVWLEQSQSTKARKAPPRLADQNAGKARCPRGHALVGANLVPSALRRGWRACLTCSRSTTYARTSRARGTAPLSVSEAVEHVLARPEWSAMARDALGEIVVVA